MKTTRRTSLGWAAFGAAFVLTGALGVRLWVLDDASAPTTTSVPGAQPSPSTPWDGSTPDEGLVPIDPGSMEAVAVRTAEFAQTLVGLSEQEATARAEEAGYVLRVASRDGENFPLTADYIAERVNIEVTEGSVTGVVVG